MKQIYYIFFIVPAIILFTTACSFGAVPGTPAYSDENFDPNQHVKKLGRNRAENTLDIRFILGGDVHFSAYRYSGKWKWGKDFNSGIGALRTASKHINYVCGQHEPDCIGVIIAGDLTRGDYWNHSLFFYRSLFEHDRNFPNDPDGEDWWDEWMPSDDDQIKYPVYPSCGNHDDGDHNSDSLVPAYLYSRLHESDALFTGKDHEGNVISNWHDNHKGDPMYAWEWGSVHFIQMGVWAFNGGYWDDNYKHLDNNRVKWLQDHLKAVGKTKAIVLIQHFDWGSDWWLDEHKKILMDVICDRPVGKDYTYCQKPYNVVALFTGHEHDFGYTEDILDGQGPRKIPEYRTDDTGHDCDGSGFYDVYINFMGATESDADGKLLGKMDVYREYMTDCQKRGDFDTKAESLDIVYSYRRELFKTQKIFTGYYRFDQGEPNNSGDHGEDCAALKTNGRYNDNRCDAELPVLCRDSDDGSWSVIKNNVQWNEAYNVCKQNGKTFTEPKNNDQQIKAINVMADAGIDEAWVNYSDRAKEGKWEEPPDAIRYFESFEPDNGAGYYEQGWGQNCAAIFKDLKFHDISCEELVKYYMCRDSSSETGWSVKTVERGDRNSGYTVCGEGSFIGPDSNDEASLNNMVKTADKFFNDTEASDAWAIWLPMSDLDEEGTWKSEKPWIAQGAGWADGEPNNTLGKEDCAVMKSDGYWNDVHCENDNDSRCACRNYQTGQWKLSETHSPDWIDGFQACRELGLTWYFAAPLREEDNNELIEIASGQQIWINYTDEDSDAGDDFEGFWRHGFWKNWREGEPNNSNNKEHCAKMSCYENVLPCWNDVDCNKTNNAVNCRWPLGSYYEGSYGGFTWNRNYYQAPDLCNSLDYQQFTYPYCPSEQSEMSENDGFGVWIQFNDLYHEGYFTPWIYNDH